jgi:hypothetical protein
MVPNGSVRWAAVKLEALAYPPSAVRPPEYTEAIPDCAEAATGIARKDTATADAHTSFVRLKLAIIYLFDC